MTQPPGVEDVKLLQVTEHLLPLVLGPVNSVSKSMSTSVSVSVVGWRSLCLVSGPPAVGEDVGELQGEELGAEAAHVGHVKELKVLQAGGDGGGYRGYESGG